MSEKILAIIPARGGSKRIPKKNIRNLCGKPLIYYSIISAKKSNYIDRIVVSTDDKEIREISVKYGVEIIDRPAEYAKDESTTIDVIFHVLDFLKNTSYEPSLIVLIQPTSPLRNDKDIDEAIELFMKSEGDTLISVTPSKNPPWWSFKIEGRRLKVIFDKKYLFLRSQDLMETYQPNGAIFISRPKELHQNKLFYSEKTIPYIMPAERSIDIDDELDFMMAECLMNKLKKGKKL